MKKFIIALMLCLTVLTSVGIEFYCPDVAYAASKKKKSSKKNTSKAEIYPNFSKLQNEGKIYGSFAKYYDVTVKVNGSYKTIKVFNPERSFDNLCQYGSIQELKEIFSKISVNAPFTNSESKETPLMYAAEMRWLGIVKALLDIGADVGVKDVNGNTALLYAMVGTGDYSEYAEEITNLLLQKGANLNARDKWGMTPIMYYSWEAIGIGIRKYNPYFLERLIKAGANVNLKDNDGRTALMGATYLMAQILLRNGADPYIKDNKGKTALDYARERSDGILHDHENLLLEAMGRKPLSLY